jgi:hypothetical protein
MAVLNLRPWKLAIRIADPVWVRLAVVALGCVAIGLLGGLQILASDATPDDPKCPVSDSTGTQRAIAAPEAVSEDVKRERLRLRMIAVRYRENREKFTSGKSRYSHVWNRANTMQDTLAGRWIDPPRVPWETTVCLHDEALVFRTKFDDANLAIKGRFAVQQSGNLATVYSPTNFRFNVGGFHPFNLVMGAAKEFSDPASVVAWAEANNYEDVQLTKQEKVIRDGAEYLLLKHRGSGAGFDADFYIDRRRGYLPISTDYFHKPTGELHARRVVLDTDRVGSSAYFPVHVMLMIQRKPQDGEPYVDVQEWKVLAQDFAQPPTAEDLTIEVPKMAQFHNQGNPNSHRTLFGNARGAAVSVSVDDIEGIYRQLEQVAADNKRTEPAGAALYAFGWLYGDTRRGHINSGQFRGRTAAGQLLYLTGNSEIQQELAIDAEQQPRLRRFLEDFERDLVAEFQPQGLSRAVILEFYNVSRDERMAKMRAVNEKFPILEWKFCEKYIATLRELLTPAQFRRLQEIRWQLAGSRSMDDPTIVESVEMTAAQQDRIRTINAEYDEQLIAYFAADFSQVPDSDVPIFQEMMTHVSEMARQRDAKASQVLSPAQCEKLDHLRGEAFKLGGIQRLRQSKPTPGDAPR